MSTLKLSTEELNNQLKLARLICSFISIPFCITIIVLYFVLCCQVCSNKKKSKNELKSEEHITQNSNTKVSMGNHFMFLLIVFNLISSIIPIIFYFAFYGENSDSNNPLLCSILGFCHNFFDGCACCVTSVIVFLFYKSTRITEFKPGQERKYMICGVLYFILATTFFTTLPFVSDKPYGWADTHCSFRYYKEKTNYVANVDNEDDKKASNYWNFVFTAFVGINCGINCIFLIIVYLYYKKKLKQMNPESHEYKLIKRFVAVFIVFPFVLVSSRIAKGIARLMETESLANTIFSYAGALLYCLNGFFNSGICFYFFRGVFTSCKDKEAEERDDDNEHTISMQHIQEELVQEEDKQEDDDED